MNMIGLDPPPRIRTGSLGRFGVSARLEASREFLRG